jgi:hypothetical protein
MKPLEEYIGQVVSVTKGESSFTLSNGETVNFETYNLDPQDPIIKEIEAVHSNVRIWLPDSCGTCDWMPSRLNVHITEGPTGVYTISSADWG